MNRLIAMLGLFCGFLAGMLLLVMNPWVTEPSVPGARANIYLWSPVEFYGVKLDANSLLNLPGGAAADTVTENLSTANASIFVLRAPGGEAVAMGTRLMAVDEDGDLLTGDIGVNAYTNLFWPNRGSVFLAGHENRWPIVRSSVVELIGMDSGISWPVSDYRPDGNPSGAVGGSGTLESVGGRYTETLKLNPEGDGSYTGELALELSLR